ncbi:MULTISPECIES: DedA family protein [unclassified Sphingomonas]|uniref:DedA family protein n=1 Tax=unclassified Sphingomonas TaxID=196159 RepID=UPI000536C73B|nr:DedA family protein [Sphingomonas sp. Ant20]KHA62952.1 membrane protein [Sphingomonas sp. Ant20]
MTIEALVARYGVVAIFLGAGVEGEAAVVTGGVLAHQGLVSLAGAMAAAVIGSFVADQLFFAGGRYFRESRPVAAIRRRSAYARAIDLLERYPRRFIFAYRFVYGIRTVSPIAIGTSRISQRVFLAVNLAAAIVWGCVFSAIGYAFGNVIEEMLGRIDTGRLILLGAAALLLVGGGWFAWRKWRERSA